MLLIFQAMDAAGKDGTIKHVMSGVNPQGCQVYSFKAPSTEELDHDFLWRTDAGAARARPHRHLQPLLLRGGAGRPRAPGDPRSAEAAAELVGQATSGSERFEDINDFERYLTRNGIVVRKFFLHVSKDEQQQALPRAPRRAGEELEVLRRRRAASASTGTTTWTPTRT